MDKLNPRFLGMLEDENKKNKNLFPEMEEDFVFPIYYNEKKEARAKNVTRKIKSTKRKEKTSPHILDLRKPVESEPTEHITQPADFNPDDWFSNFKEHIEAQVAAQARAREIDFESPDHSELATEKIKYSKPLKKKSKSKVKLNLGQDIIQQLEKSIKVPKRQPAALLFLKKLALLIINIIIFPFRALDFIIDRTLKTIWWIIKFTALTIFAVFKSIFLNLIRLFRGQRLIRAPVTQRVAIMTRFKYKPVLVFALICLIIILPFQILNWQQKASDLKGQVLGQSMQGLDALKNASVLSQEFNFEQAGQQFSQAYFNFTLAQNYLDNLDIFSQQIIKIIPQTSQADNLLIIGQLSAKLGQDLSTLAQELDTQPDEDITLVQKLENIQTTLNNIEPNFLELLTRINDINAQALVDQLGDDNLNKLILFQSSLQLLKNNFDNLKSLNQFLLDFLGQHASKKYLVIFQNNSELRPTGGFMGSYALVEVKNGEIINMEVPGGGFYDLKAANQTLVEAPKPFHLFSPTWQIWNANWFPDWPASAQKISWFYENSLAGVTVDGVLSLTPDVIENLLEMLGPIEMPEYDKIINAENFVRELQLAVEIEYDQEENQPKKIIADLMPVILENIFNLELENASQFLQILNNNLKHKNILFWFKDDEMQQLIENFDWDGKIKDNQGDYLMVIHTNVGGGKTDRVIENKILHNIEIDNNGNIFDTVSLTRIHNGQIGDIFEDQNNVDYIRFYVPDGSELISVDGFDQIPNNLFKIALDQDISRDADLEDIEKNPILDERFNTRITNEFGKTCFGNWLMIEPGEEKTVTLKYKLPFKINKSKQNLLDKLVSFVIQDEPEILRYNLIIQKQPGLSSTDFTSQLYLPTDWQVVNMTSVEDKIKQNINGIIYQDNLETDGYYGVEIR